MLYCDYVVELGKLPEQDTLGAPLLEEGWSLARYLCITSSSFKTFLYTAILLSWAEQNTLRSLASNGPSAKMPGKASEVRND